MNSRALVRSIAAGLVLLGSVAAYASPSDDVKSCTQVIDNMLEANWSEPPAELATALGVSNDFVRGCVAAYKAHKTKKPKMAGTPTCAQIMAALEGAGAQKSTDEVAAELHTTAKRVRECAHKSGD